MRVLGRGPRGTVYLARDLGLNRIVALKVGRDQGDESRTTAVFEHEQIVRVYSEAVQDRARLICREYVPGATLDQVAQALRGRNRDGMTGEDILAAVDRLTLGPNPFQADLAAERLEFSRLPFGEAVARIGAGVADALQHAHRRGALHLNVKPSNIHIDPYGRPRLADFTLFRARFGFTGTPPPLGRSRYTAPEVRAALDDGGTRAIQAIDGRADLYSLALVLNDLAGASGSASRDARPSRSAMRSALPDVGLSDVLLAASHPSPERRLPDAETFANRLRGLLELRHAREAMPNPGFLMRFSRYHPLLGLFTVRLLPHLIGTLICFAYCLFRRGLTMNPGQKAQMVALTQAYNSISYPTGIFLVVALVWPLVRAYSRRRAGGDSALEGGVALQKLRLRALKLPWRLALVHTITWLPSIPVLAIAAYRLTGRFHPTGFFHFSSAVVLSWLTATAYSTLYMLFFAVEVLYPRFADVGPQLRDVARAELTRVGRLVDLLPPLLAFIPLFAALLLIQQDPPHLCVAHFRQFQLLLVALIVGGAAGFLFSMGAIRRLKRVIHALGGGTPALTPARRRLS